MYTRFILVRIHAITATVDFNDRENPELKLARMPTVNFPDKLDLENASRCAAEFITQLKKDRTGRNWVNEEKDDNTDAGASADVDTN